MKTKLLLILFAFATLTARGQGTAFTYQGRLNDGASPANGIYDLQFGLYDAASGGTLKGSLLTNSNTGVTNGLFTLTLDFGNQFPGTDRFLEISVRTNGAVGFSTLSPRQTLAPAPYSITAGNVVSGGLAAGTYGNAVTFSNSANQFTGAFTGNGANMTNINAATLGGLRSSNFWTTAGNTNANPTNGNFLGSIDNMPLEIRVNNQRVMRFAYASNFLASDNPNLIGGSQVNFVKSGVVGATIAGGGRSGFTNSIQGDFSSIGGGLGNSAFGFYDTIGGGQQNSSGSFVSDYSTVGGGTGNIANGDSATVSGGNGNFASGNSASVGGGSGNGAQQTFGTIGGGSANSVLGSFNIFYGTVAGGHSNTIHGAYASIPGGEMNTADGNYSLAAGRLASASHDGAFVWADSIDAPFASTGTNQFLIRAGGGVGINTTNPASELDVNGTVTIAAGSASAPTLSFSGDADTGIYHPLLNTVAITTAGVERLRVNSSGNVGVGTASPATALHVRDTDDAEISVESLHGGERWTLQSSGTNTANKIGSFQVIDRTANSSRLLIDTSGNVGIGTVPTTRLHVLGGATFTSGAGGANQTVSWTPGNASWSFTSDRNTKDRVVAVAPQTILEKLLRVPINEWSYVGFDQRHLGPMAQDFHAQFPMNPDEKSLNDADLHGVALAAIQGLNEKVEVRTQNSESRITKLEEENAELKQRLASLERLVLAQDKIRRNNP